MNVFGMFDDNFFSPFAGLRAQQSRSMQDMHHHLMNSMFADPFAGNEEFHMGNQRRDIMPFGAPFGFPNMNRMLHSMRDLSSDPNSHSFSSSSFMSMTTGPDGRPQVYQESRSSRHAPGGISETHHSVADTVSGKKKLAIGQHIQDRGHVVEREKNLHTGDEEEREEYINIEEENAHEFDAEFRNHTQQYRQHAIGSGRPHSSHHAHRHYDTETPQLAIQGTSYEPEARRADRAIPTRHQEKKVKRLKGQRK